jgi:hypothetical protein
MAWTITWRPGIRDRFESFLGKIGAEASKCVEEGLRELPVPLPGPSPHCVIVIVRDMSLDCCVDPVSQTADIRGVDIDEQS